MSLFSRMKEKQKELELQKQATFAAAVPEISVASTDSIITSSSDDFPAKSVATAPETPVKKQTASPAAASSSKKKRTSAQMGSDRDDHMIHDEDEEEEEGQDEDNEGEDDENGEWISPKQKGSALPLKYIPNKLRAVELDKLVWAPYFNYRNKLFPARLCVNQEALSETTIVWPIPDECCVVEIFGQIENSKNRKLLQVFRNGLLPYYASDADQVKMNDYDESDLDHWNDTLCMKLKQSIAKKATSKRNAELAYEHIMTVANQFLELSLKQAQQKALSADLMLQTLPEVEDEDDDEDEEQGKESKLDQLKIGDETDLSIAVGDKICYFDKVLSSRLHVTTITGFTKDPQKPLELKNGDILYSNDAVGKLDPSVDDTNIKHPDCNFYPVSRYFECMENNQSKKSKKNKKNSSETDKTTKKVNSSSSSSKDFEVTLSAPTSPVKTSRKAATVSVAESTPVTASSKSKKEVKLASTAKVSKQKKEDTSKKNKDEDDIDVDDFFGDSNKSKKTSHKGHDSKLSQDDKSDTPSQVKRSRKDIEEKDNDIELPSTGSRKRYAREENEPSADSQDIRKEKQQKRAVDDHELPPADTNQDKDGQGISPTTSKFHSKRKMSSK